MSGGAKNQRIARDGRAGHESAVKLVDGQQLESSARLHDVGLALL
jgi:hypothetical protein